ncbi:MAG: nitrogen regulation protein NR(II) [Thermodesulfobacteriota bacterium]
MNMNIDKDFLNRAFKDFEESSRKLERQYAMLGDKFGELEREFSGKNKAAERTARLAAMGEMAAKIAHEIRNPLGSMLIFSTILCRELSGQAENQKLAGHILESVRNLDRILSDMLVFSNGPEPSLEPIDIRDVMEDAIETCSGRSADKDIMINRSYSGSTLVRADAGLLRQLVLNLLFNAFDAIGDETGSINISTAIVGSQTLEVTVEDTGCGMDESVEDRIFDPFFTTRHSGTGLGLAIVASIARAHGGEITCSRRAGSGTRFTLSLPWSEDHTEPVQPLT